VLTGLTLKAAVQGVRVQFKGSEYLKFPAAVQDVSVVENFKYSDPLN
jgi:hypothetical protein